MAPTVDVVSAEALDLDAFADLQRRAFAEVLAATGADDAYLRAELFAWKYAPPAGPARIAVVRDDAGALIAANAMFPMEVVGPGGQTRIAWQSCDTATAPEGRGQGSFTRCLRALVDDLDEGDLFFGFPNANSLRGFEKIGWGERGVVTTWARPVLPLGVSGLGRLRTTLAAVPAGSLDDVRIATGGAWEVRRSRAWLRHRYAAHPIHDYRVLIDLDDEGVHGLGVLRRVRSVGRELAVALELWGDGLAAERRVWSGMVHQARELRTSGIVLLDSGRPLGRIPTLLPVPARYLPKRQVLMGGVKRDGAMDAGAFPERWRVQTGDWDGF